MSAPSAIAYSMAEATHAVVSRPAGSETLSGITVASGAIPATPTPLRPAATRPAT